MVNSFKTREVGAIPVNEEHLINFKILNLILMQQLKCEKEPPLPFNAHTLAIYL
jgi:hypothetical protein